MDTLRGTLGAFDAHSETHTDYDGDEESRAQDRADEEIGERDGPPPMIGNDERRMQVRAYNFWATGLADRNFPDIADLDWNTEEDFGPHSVLLDFTDDPEDPKVGFLGATLARECDAEHIEIDRLSDVPSRSLLSRITDHYMQIIANQAPIGFEAEFVNQRGKTVLYRGILLPYSSDDHTIDFIYGVINWKELADQDAADALLLEIGQAIDAPDSPLARRHSQTAPLTDWADGPGSSPEVELTYGEADEHAAYDHTGHSDDASSADLTPSIAAPDEQAQPAAPMALGEWLTAARNMAAEARANEERSRTSLYDAIGLAWDFALAAAEEPQDFAALVDDAGLKVQARAPMTPIVKLVFGANYDKTRLTEYAAALAHAARLGLDRGALAQHLRSVDGGLKGVVAAERRCRREEAGATPRVAKTQPRKNLARKLRQMPASGLMSIPAQGEEFALVLVRRTQSGEVVLLGELPGDAAMIEKAARKLVD